MIGQPPSGAFAFDPRGPDRTGNASSVSREVVLPLLIDPNAGKQAPPASSGCIP